MYSKSRSCIKVKTGLTNYIDLNLGVRQGDNLSPNLFKIFINDLPKYLEETIDPVNIGDLTLNCLMYADDVVMLSTSKTVLQENQRTNGPVNAHLRSAILTKYLFKKFALYGAPPTNQNKGLGQKSTKL